jgi:type III pantothenate kinase
MKSLVIDIGNSSLKAAFSEGIKLGEVFKYDGDDAIGFVKGIIQKDIPEALVVSSVRGDKAELLEKLETIFEKVAVVGINASIPIKSYYSTPETVGADRIAASAGAGILFPGKKCIIFDFGTALTIDFTDEYGNFSGGNISLGLSTRFKALNFYTDKLPLLTIPENIGEIGESTPSAIENGIILGMINEVEGYIRKYPDYIIIFTGGDSNYFAIKLKSPIFVIYNLVLTGLARIAENNVQE